MLRRSAIGDGASRSAKGGSRMGDESRLTGEWYKCSAQSSRNLPAVSAAYSAASVRFSAGCSELGEFFNPTGKAQGPRSLGLRRREGRRALVKDVGVPPGTFLSTLCATDSID